VKKQENKKDAMCENYRWVSTAGAEGWGVGVGKPGSRR
jgi:hypothetical protein